MAIAIAFNAPAHSFWASTYPSGVVSVRCIGSTCPHLQTASFSMAYIVALVALEYVLSLALAGFVTDTIALEAELLRAFKTIVAIFTAQYAVESCTLEIIGTVTRQMSKLLTIATLDRRIVKVLKEIAWRLLLQFWEKVFLFFLIRLGYIRFLRGLIVSWNCLCNKSFFRWFRIWLLFRSVLHTYVPAEIRITFEAATWC